MEATWDWKREPVYHVLLFHIFRSPFWCRICGEDMLALKVFAVEEVAWVCSSVCCGGRKQERSRLLVNDPPTHLIESPPGVCSSPASVEGSAARSNGSS